MVYASNGRNCFRWPTKDDILNYELEHIALVIESPVQINQHHFGIIESHLLIFNRNYECYDTSHILIWFLHICYLSLHLFSLLKYLTYKRNINQ